MPPRAVGRIEVVDRGRRREEGRRLDVHLRKSLESRAAKPACAISFALDNADSPMCMSLLQRRADEEGYARADDGISLCLQPCCHRGAAGARDTRG